MVFRPFLLHVKRSKGFQVTGRYQFLCYQCSFIYKTESHSFETWIFSQDIWGNVCYAPEINLIPLGTLIKTFYLQRKTNKKKPKSWFSRRKTGKDENANINVSPNIPSTSFSLKLVHFFNFFSWQIYFLSFSQ